MTNDYADTREALERFVYQSCGPQPSYQEIIDKFSLDIDVDSVVSDIQKFVIYQLHQTKSIGRQSSQPISSVIIL